MLDRAALTTTKFMMPAAWRIPEWAKMRTNGLCVTTVAPVSVQGTKVTTMVSARMQNRNNRNAMERSAAGMVRTGSLASPEVTAMTSMPLNDRIPSTTAIQTPPNRCGRNPPGSRVKLWKPTGFVHSPKMVAIPKMMKMTIATTLMSANQYSMEPKLCTERELK